MSFNDEAIENDSYIMCYFNSELNKLTSLRDEINWEIEKERYNLLEKLYPLINDWKSRIPDLRDIFQVKQIERLLLDAASYRCDDENFHRGQRFIDFVIKTGYKNNLDVAQMFLEFGQDPKCLAQKLFDDPPLHLAVSFYRETVAASMLRNGADPNSTNAKGLTPLHIVCKGDRDDYKFAKMLFELSHDRYKPVLVNVQDKSGKTPLHLAVMKSNKEVVKFLLRDGANPNLSDEEGFTPLHLVVMERRDINLAKMLFELSHDQYKPVQIDVRDKLGNTPLHLAVSRENKVAVQFLLRDGANPNSANAKGLTPLHIIGMEHRDINLAKMLFELSDEKYRPVQIDARDQFGRTALHFAVHSNNLLMTYFLLNKGANPNSISSTGGTPLHMIVDKFYDNEFAKEFFKINDDLQQTVLVNVQNMLGNTPLHLAATRGHKGVVQLLLRRGADPNLANAQGLTPLHIICDKTCDYGLAKIFFEINDDRRQVVQIDAKEKLGRTPLQLAVKNLLPDVVDILLEHGALASFVFPTKSHFNARFKTAYNIELRIASGAMAVIELLEKKGYELDRSNALTMMTFFVENGLCEKSSDCNERWYDDEKFASEAKKIMMNSSLSLYDLIHLQPAQAEKLLTFTDYCAFERSENLANLPGGYIVPSALHLCETMCRRFFRRWALDSSVTLTRYRLPLLCCVMINELLMNKDLWRICLAAADQNS